MSQSRADGFSQAKRRVLVYVLVVVFMMLLYAILYQVGMQVFEDRSIRFVEALHVVVETFTTTGYGEDASQWTTDGILLLMMAMQITGVTLIFLTLPLFLVPLVEAALSRDVPTESELTDHVIICNFTPRGDTLVDELRAMDIPYVVVEDDQETAAELDRDGYDVVLGDPEEVDVLRGANATAARALVADAADEVNASIILSAKEAAPDLTVISLISDPTVVDYHRYAGADKVVSPRRLLGESLAGKATTSISSQLGDAVELGEDFEVAELLVQRGSHVEGKTIEESHIADVPGVNVIGAWFRGEFASPPRPDAVIDEHTILLVAGPEQKLERLKELTLSETREFRRGKVIVAGFGEVGATAADSLIASNVPTEVIDLEDVSGVDVVGDVTDRGTLQTAGIQDARSIILALSDDTTAIFASLVVKQVAPDVEVIARANASGSISKLYRAGAEYVLSLSTVSGRMLASNLLDEEIIAPQAQIEIVRLECPSLNGRTLAQADVRARTNCTVIAAERNGDLLTDVGPDFRVMPGDQLILAGADEDINRFNELLG
jgi:Trk K+ transport system NAD-binding subunit